MKGNPFIDRPVFAAVISVFFVLAGTVATRVLPVEQYPQIVPPQAVVQAPYPGASAKNVARTVAAHSSSRKNMLYMQSTNSTAGTMRLTVTCAIGTNLERHDQRQQPSPAGPDRQQAIELDPRFDNPVVERQPALHLSEQLCAA
jgi:multidrug efflux pump subunit AcrB